MQDPDYREPRLSPERPKEETGEAIGAGGSPLRPASPNRPPPREVGRSGNNLLHRPKGLR